MEEIPEWLGEILFQTSIVGLSFYSLSDRHSVWRFCFRYLVWVAFVYFYTGQISLD